MTNESHFDALKVFRFSCLLAALLVLAGCGSNGPPRYEVRGNVQYENKPVPAGRVVFEPAAGKKGPAGYAEIKNGSYTTMPGKGTVGGPHEVRVLCYDGVPVPGELPDGHMLRPEFRTQVDLPEANFNYNIIVPPAQ